jgi:uncharacterized protein YcsI (UPF0317 family)
MAKKKAPTPRPKYEGSIARSNAGRLKGKVIVGSKKLKAANKADTTKGTSKLRRDKVGTGQVDLEAKDTGKWLDGYSKVNNRTMRRKKNGL